MVNKFNGPKVGFALETGGNSSILFKGKKDRNAQKWSKSSVSRSQLRHEAVTICPSGRTVIFNSDSAETAQPQLPVWRLVHAPHEHHTHRCFPKSFPQLASLPAPASPPLVC